MDTATRPARTTANISTSTNVDVCCYRRGAEFHGLCFPTAGKVFYVFKVNNQFRSKLLYKYNILLSIICTNSLESINLTCLITLNIMKIKLIFEFLLISSGTSNNNFISHNNNKIQCTNSNKQQRTRTIGFHRH